MADPERATEPETTTERDPRPSDLVPRLPLSVGISEREMMGYGPSLWSRLKKAWQRRRK